jgi:hypothetical protein
VLVVKGKENPTTEFDLLEIVEVTPVEQVTYRPTIRSSPAANWARATRRLIFRSNGHPRRRGLRRAG